MQFTDLFGRKSCLLICGAMSIIIMTGLLFVDDYFFLKVILSTINFGCSDTMFSLSFIYIAEVSSAKWSQYSGAYLLGAFSIGEILLASFMYINNGYSGIFNIILII